MNGIHLHTGNQLEALAAQLRTVLSKPLRHPFTPEVILVQSLGMSRWISLQLADQLGICMNVEFPFPKAFLGRTLRTLFPQLAPDEAFSSELLTWKIHHLLPSLLHRPEYDSVRTYLADRDPLKVYQLAARLARLYDHYLAYRPEMLLQWEAGEENRQNPLALWQADLWRHLNREKAFHFASALHTLRHQGLPEEGKAILPERLSLFGISSLPPAQLEILYHLAKAIPVHLFLLSPSQEYFGDDLTPKERARRGVTDETGNPLLTSLGKLNAHFTELRLEIDERIGPIAYEESESFVLPERETLLHQIQRDILFANPPTPISLSPEDDSLQIHSCHSPTREVEILYNQILAMLEADPTLAPRDFLVMAPDIEKYAPLIQAIFGNPEDPSLRIPFSVADRHARSESLTIDTFLRLIELPLSRCTASEVFTLLESPPFKKRYQFSEEDLEQIRLWINESGIRWGLNAAHRASLGLSHLEETTWQHGLDRLLLGYAMTGENRVFFDNILPYDDIEGESASLLGRLYSAIEAITEMVQTVREPRPLAEWPSALGMIVDRFFTSPKLEAEESPTVKTLRESLLFLQRMAEASTPEQLVTYEVIREALNNYFAETEGEGRFLTGGVTFCALKPMRSVPARVIWLLGLDDGLFPRTQTPLQFDITAREWKLGDRNVKIDDRYLFLEALVSARERLCISYLGRSSKDNSEVPPSVIVTELLDYLNPMVGSSKGEAPYFYPHRLHGYSDYYYSPEQNETQRRLWSFSKANAVAANAVHTHLGEIPFVSTPLPPFTEESPTLPLDNLIAFLRNPCAFFLKHRLGITLREEAIVLQEDETVPLSELISYQLRNERLQGRLRGNPLPAPASYAARAILPSGNVTAPMLLRIDQRAESFYQNVCERLAACGPRKEPFSIDLLIGNHRIVGTLSNLYGKSCVAFRPARIKPKDELLIWVQYLVYRLQVGADAEPAFLLGEDQKLRFEASIEHCHAALTTLLRIYEQGLTCPIPFFPDSSQAYAAAIAGGKKTHEEALASAWKKWQPSFNTSGELSDTAVQLCFQSHTAPPPFTEQFESLALAIYGPLLEAQIKL